ncbi:uncharacterized protein LOC121377065 [Gigantopelta aegis]|uniref:uncharacterized protein LOC121377065 n=1 Tax=Gigantopelta aegis TaxID=1735272 RepID=UPI001B8898FE|nr:uncharacterized protein LOC121377065 [Gigantopelta aegis]
MNVLLVLAACISVCSAHLCMLSPPQRGSMNDINKKGANDCFLINKPCGGRPGSTNPLILKAGQNFTVTFQKNLDHWVKATPGYFSINWMDMTVSPMMTSQLYKIADMGEPSLTLYSQNVTIPKTSKSGTSYILQTQYVTNNAKAPPVFYQCSDITVA